MHVFQNKTQKREENLLATVALELRNITKTFGKIVANKNVCMEVKKGEILSVLGENGSGKTTLMNIIAGIYFPDEGQTTIKCACGNVIETGSTKENISVEICSACHPFFTGKQKLVDTGGRVEKFRKRFNLDK